MELASTTGSLLAALGFIGPFFRRRMDLLQKTIQAPAFVFLNHVINFAPLGNNPAAISRYLKDSLGPAGDAKPTSGSILVGKEKYVSLASLNLKVRRNYFS